MKVGTQKSKESTFRGIYKPTKCGPFVFWSSLVCNMGLVWFLVLEIIRRKKKGQTKHLQQNPSLLKVIASGATPKTLNSENMQSLSKSREESHC